jgi:hypothetical protein
VVVTTQTPGADEDPEPITEVTETTQTKSDGDDETAPGLVQGHNRIVIQTVEPDGKNKRGKEVSWLGLAVEEASEALSSQLGLKPGEGLTVTLLAAGSPAAKADFHKNDVLVEFDGQMLVHPIQLRKLVRMHAEGDTVKLTFYRGGKKQTASVKLVKTILETANDTEATPMPGDLQNLQLQFKNLSGDLNGMSESLERVGLDKAKVNSEVRRTMEQTRRAIQDAVRRASSDRRSLTSMDRQLEALARDGVDVNKEATVIVRNKRNSSRTIVETDDNGTYIIEAGAKTHLTARDKHGKLLFEGEIDTPAEQEKVPKEVWEKAKPMFDQIAPPIDNEPKGEGKSGNKPNSRNKLPVGGSFQCA